MMGDSPRKNSKQQFEDDFLLFEDNDPDESGDSEEQINLPRSLILVERLIYTIEDEDPIKQVLYNLRREIIQEEITFQEARKTLAEMQKSIDKLTAPANRVATLINLATKDCAQVILGGSEYYTNIDSAIDPASLKIGHSVLLNEAYVIVGDLGYNQFGPTVKITDLLPDGRLKIGQEQGLNSQVLQRSSDLVDEDLKTGDQVRVDPNFRVALERIEGQEASHYYVENLPEVPWEKVGGLDDTIQLIKDTIELPILHPDLFRKFDFSMPKGFLLHGPPGCGKTLVGKATAYGLTERLKEESNIEIEGCFLHIKGPEILNMWLGESERKVREIFDIARQKKKEGMLPFIFIDEAESILGTRRSLRAHNISNTVVPMFCAEMDGIESLQDIVIILATNRPDLIDPAVLRPGRIDRKIKVNRPDKESASKILNIYLTQELPISPELLEKHGNNVTSAVDNLTDQLINEMFSRTETNRFLEVSLQSGRRDILHRGDLCSGAIIASIVQRAKESAIKRIIQSGDESIGICLSDLLDAFHAEYTESDIFPSTDNISDWLKLIDYDPENVVKVVPTRPEKSKRKKRENMSVI
jgi:proteasome-associated ATPase|tara:strand:+ start:475 stop:2229 length:1755 start_codon:yes stop_codon:yes gene_type:complete